jgi:hypothetical protein
VILVLVDQDSLIKYNQQQVIKKIFDEVGGIEMI